MFQHKFGYLTGYSNETYNPPASEASKGGNKFNLKKKSTYPFYYYLFNFLIHKSST